MTLWASGAALCAVALTGCGDSSADSPPSSSASSLSSSPADSGSDSGAEGAAAGYTDEEACAWLKENLPGLPDTEVGAMAQLAIGLSTFFEEHGGLENADGYVLDEALTRGCPDLRDEAVKKAGIKTFGNL